MPLMPIKQVSQSSFAATASSGRPVVRAAASFGAKVVVLHCHRADNPVLAPAGSKRGCPGSSTDGGEGEEGGCWAPVARGSCNFHFGLFWYIQAELGYTVSAESKHEY